MDTSSPLQPIDPSVYGITQPDYANFWHRLVAYLIDGLVLAIPVMIVQYLFRSQIGWIAGIAVHWLYFAYFESSPTQATFGKQAMGIKVTDENGVPIDFARASGRYFSKYISAVILLIGYLMVLWTEKKQGLHDIIARTLVVKK